ncbi:MAG: PSD1 and planctomycete cytochrome C domain-containing protein [Verrucomicrobiales bacterium]|nr:PSD1 and planctomycete cytochrome C domain-containing protein [Verrucomicrobiales bacterium]
MTDLQQLDEWIVILSERSLTESERSDFQALLRRSPDALDRYLDHCQMETWLAAAGEGGNLKIDSREVFRAVDREGAMNPRGVKRWVFGAVAVIAVIFVAGKLLLPAPEEMTPDIVEVPVGESSISEPPVEETLAVAEETRERDPWKVINATGSVQHPGLKDKPVSVVAPNRPIKFNRDIRPILSETCFHCHGPDEHGRRADLRLDSLAGATTDLGGTVAIVPGDLEKSEAWWRIISDDADELMPPPESHLVLTEDQKELIRRWIEEGAEYEGHWAYEAPVRTEVPQTGWGNGEIDSFIHARLIEEGMKPSPEADPRTLIRRLTFDLTGLPPTHEEVNAFLASYAKDRETTWAKAIDRLLSSPHFGERMAVPWLDQARYADTNGYSIDGGRQMWLWRDWVIQAYNENKPFDQFTIEQIGGDLLPEATPAQMVATGFNRNHMITHEGGTIPAENLTNYAADRVKTTSEVFLGLTMACAQCHDHKYDPISIKEYYEFFSFFNELSDRGNDGNGGKNAVPRLMAETVIPDDELPALQKELEALKASLNERTEGFDEWLVKTQAEERARGREFSLHRLETLDVSSPNRPGPFEVAGDGSIVLSEPSTGLNAFSHALALPEVESINGIRVRILPQPGTGKLTPHPDNVPKITTVLVSAGIQPAKQVEYYSQLRLASATASSNDGVNLPENVLDERNLHWWQPDPSDSEPHLTVTFDAPVNPAETPYLSVMVFYGQRESLPFQWRVDAFSGEDTDSSYPADLAAILQQDRGTWSPEEKERVLSVFRNEAPGLERERIRIANLEERIEVLTGAHSTMVMDTSPTPRETFVLSRGQYDAPTEKVSSTTPRVLPPLKADGKATRLDLAHWMVDPANPLTARVAVNRIWQIIFGTGIVATTADFGSQGEWPSHPELIDWLAVEFMESGWDQKALIRKMVSSATYRQDSSADPEERERDPGNRLLARGPRFRLAAEFVRDQSLAVSGLLVPRIGGPSVQPYQPAGLWKEVSHFGSTPATKQVFVQDHGEKLYRRSLYTIVKRTSPHPSMSAFDAPNREMCITERGITNTPLQALVTLNDPQFAEASRVFAAKLLDETMGTEDIDRLTTAFEMITGRLATDAELNALGSFLTDERARYEADEAAARSLIAVGESPVNHSHAPVDQAVWTQVSSLLFNLSETLTRL